MSDTVLHVGGGSPYDVVVGHDLTARLPGLLGESVERVAVLYAGTLGALADPIVDALVEHYDVLALGLPEGERAKTAPVAADCWEALGEAGFTRSDAVVTIGGGSATDLGGFVAATWLRGVRVVHVPTTLLAMVDAAVGGKTGINTGAGKNLVGAFHEPAGVLCDLSAAGVAAARRARRRAGRGRQVRLHRRPDHPRDRRAHRSGRADRRLRRAARARRARDPGQDRRRRRRPQGDRRADGGVGREVLNYGHTLAHAIERTSDYAVRHGEAVAIGCVYVAELAARAGSLDPAVVERHRTALARVGLPTTYDVASFDDLHAAMKVDKKARGSQLRFVVLDDLGSPRILAGPGEEDLRAAYAAIASAG